jgi:hypothetical protein
MRVHASPCFAALPAQAANGASSLAGPFEMNAEAWRWLDRLEGQSVSRSEEVGEWMFERSVRRGL